MTQDKMSGNKGEWSELYVFFRLLADGRVYAADENVNKIEDIYYPIIKIMREEKKGSPIDYVINRDRSCIDIVKDGKIVDTISQREMAEGANDLLYEINEGRNSFEISHIAEFAHGILVHKIKAPSVDKTDIFMQIEDLYTNSCQDVGFSVKSEIGSSPTLLNASQATNFVFAVHGLKPDSISQINSIETREKIKDRMGAIRSLGGSLEFRKTASKTFGDNLTLIDSLLPEIFASLLKVSYSQDIMNMRELINVLEKENPCEYSRNDMYGYKIRKALCACALGMKPAVEWDGSEEANGGYIIVRDTGEVLAYHIYNREAFELYLLNNTKLDRPSTGRQKYLSLYEEGGEVRMNLNLQIRFV